MMDRKTAPIASLHFFFSDETRVTDNSKMVSFSLIYKRRRRTNLLDSPTPPAGSPRRARPARILGLNADADAAAAPRRDSSSRVPVEMAQLMEVGVLDGGPGQLSPVRELLGLHSVIRNAEMSPSFKVLARAAYNQYDFSATILIIKALTEKAEDLRMLEEEHAAMYADLDLRRRRIKYLADHLAYDDAAPLRRDLEILEPSIAYHLSRRIYAWRELKKINYHLSRQYRNLERLV